MAEQCRSPQVTSAWDISSLLGFTRSLLALGSCMLLADISSGWGLIVRMKSCGNISGFYVIKTDFNRFLVKCLINGILCLHNILCLKGNICLDFLKQEIYFNSSFHSTEILLLLLLLLLLTIIISLNC